MKAPASNKTKPCLEDGHGHGRAWQCATCWQSPLGTSWAHSCSSKACPAPEPCKQLRNVHGARLVVHHSLPGNAETAWDCHYIHMSLQKHTFIGGGNGSGKGAGIPCHWLAVGGLCSRSGWPSAQEKHGAGITRGRERRWARAALHCSLAISKGQYVSQQPSDRRYRHFRHWTFPPRKQSWSSVLLCAQIFCWM